MVDAEINISPSNVHCSFHPFYPSYDNRGIQMIKYGLELEGFAVDSSGEIVVPPKEWPVDGFPGLIEIRTTGGKSLGQQYGSIIESIHDLVVFKGVEADFIRSEYKFTGQEMSYMRTHRLFNKNVVNIQNIYGKSPRRLGNLTIASLQISISNEISREQKSAIIDSKGNALLETRPPRYGLLDIPRIIRGLDKVFEHEIKQANRQPGMYALKNNDTRLEYRSLPNFVFYDDDFVSKVKSVVEPKI